jgi:hypothetical protein
MWHQLLLTAVLSLAALPGASFAQSWAMPLFGKKMLIKNVGDEPRTWVVLIAKDPAVTVPAAGMTGDPRCPADPGSVVVIGAWHHQEPLVCGNWTLLGSETAPRGYRYRDPELDDGTVRSIVWKRGLLKLLIKGSGATSGADYAEVTLFQYLGPGANGYCVFCQGSDGRDGSDGKFVGKNCPPQAACISSASGTFLD